MIEIGPLLVSGQSIAVVLMTLLLIAALFLFFEQSLLGKALRATAVNPLGARLVAISPDLCGRTALGLGFGLGALGAVLILLGVQARQPALMFLGLALFGSATASGRWRTPACSTRWTSSWPPAVASRSWRRDCAGSASRESSCVVVSTPTWGPSTPRASPPPSRHHPA